MAVSNKQRHALKLAEKRRQRRPVTDFQEPVSLKVKPAERDRFTHSFPKVLLAIEAILAESFLADSSIDDAIVLKALRSCIREESSQDELVAWLIATLRRGKETAIGYHERADEIWSTGLRIIHQSVRAHSSGEPNERGYLNFAVNFVNSATSQHRTGHSSR